MFHGNGISAKLLRGVCLCLGFGVQFFQILACSTCLMKNRTERGWLKPCQRGMQAPSTFDVVSPNVMQKVGLAAAAETLDLKALTPHAKQVTPKSNSLRA